MKRVLLLASLALCNLTFAAPPTEASIDQLVTLTHSPNTLDAMTAAVERSIRQGVEASTHGKSLTAQQQKAVQVIPDQIMQFVRQQLNWAKLKPLVAQAYMETYSQEEVDELIRFFGSPVGRRFVDKQPQLVQRMSAATQQLVATALPKFQAALLESLRQAGIEAK